MSDSKINWITLEQASEISGASVAIIQDTIRRYQNNPQAFHTKLENNTYYVDQAQILHLFSSSSHPTIKEKIPGTLFRWFDELRKTYENSLSSMHKKIEKVQDESQQNLKHQYETRIFELEEQYQQQILSLKQAHSEQIKLLKRNILKLEKDISFYQKQATSQHESMAQLNARYDAILFALKDQHQSAPAEKNITPALNNTEQPATTEQKKSEPTSAQSSQNGANSLLNSAFKAREQQEYTLANELFEQAALQGNNQAMGALAKSYFTAQGVNKNDEKAIAWLYLAAEFKFEPAIEKIAKFKQSHPQQYQNALELADAIRCQIQITADDDLAVPSEQQADHYHEA